MRIKGELYAESPIYRGNARKTLFTRDGDGTHKLVSLAGEISGTAQALMDAFVGQSKNGKNIGLLNALWKRLYGNALPDRLIRQVECKLQKASYPRNNFFDMRMGIRLNEDRWAVEANANYKMETVLKKSVFDFSMEVADDLLSQDDNQARLFYLLQELQEGRFWFGAGKSKGLGRLRLAANLPIKAPDSPPSPQKNANHLQIEFEFDAENPLLVGWNWGKIDPHQSAFPSVEGRLLVESMKTIPVSIRQRLEMVLGGAILSTDDWKQKLGEFLPRIVAIWLKEDSGGQAEGYVLPEAAIAKLGKGKHGLNAKLLNKIKPFAGKMFATEEEADAAFADALGKKANMSKRVTAQLDHVKMDQSELNQDAWKQVKDGLGLDPKLAGALSEKLNDEDAMIKVLTPAINAVLPRLHEQVDQQIKLLQSDAWVDTEIKSREEHLQIKTMLKNGKITEYQWNDPGMPPEGIRSATWREFLDAHSKVRFRHMLNARNLDKSIVNDRNQIDFLKTYRERTRQELSQPKHIDFRAGGKNNREISKKYGKPFDTIFMRMLSWAPAKSEAGAWEVYIPGGTIKGAFRKRASQALKTLWGDGRKTDEVLNRMFGTQGRRGKIFFSDAYLVDPDAPEKNWCSMDGVKMDPTTGQPIESAKRDYLYAYGKELKFQVRMDIQDIGKNDLDIMSILFHLINDYKAGDIPIGGDKTSGFGWTEASVARMLWLAGDPAGVGQTLFGQKAKDRKGLWHVLELKGTQAEQALQPASPIAPEGKSSKSEPPATNEGFISHRSFGGHCGTLVVDAELLTPLNIRESGEPSFTANLDGERINGWDFFSMSPPEAAQRSNERQYALPGRSIKGMIRHLYTIASDSRQDGGAIGRLNPTQSLFGWVGDGPNQALMGRIVFSTGFFDALKQDPVWFKVPYPYGAWRFKNGKWQETLGAQADPTFVGGHWRVFPHAPLVPAAEQTSSFGPDTVQASYFRALMPGEQARFTIRFWNLTEEELKRLVWCVALEPGMAHKLGNHRYLGFGSLRLSVSNESFLIDWEKRYDSAPAEKAEWRQPLKAADFVDSKTINHHAQLKKTLDAGAL